VTSEPFITLLDTNVQWVFKQNRPLPTVVSFRGPGLPEESAFSSGEHKTAQNQSDGQYLQLVISASYDLLKKSREEIIDLCLKEIRQALPAAREAQLVKATVIKEASATFSPEPGVDRFRPRTIHQDARPFPRRRLDRHRLARHHGRAVRSGYLAAEAVLRSAGAPAQFLQPDLAPPACPSCFLERPFLMSPGQSRIVTT